MIKAISDKKNVLYIVLHWEYILISTKAFSSHSLGALEYHTQMIELHGLNFNNFFPD